MSKKPTSQKIVVAGSGFAGMWSAISAARAVSLAGKTDEVEVIMVSPTPAVTIRPRLYEALLENMKPDIKAVLDAVGAAAKNVAARTNRHRALLVVTDGVDTGSKLTASEVSGIASSIDVPVYLLTVVSPLDHPGGELSVLAADGASTTTATLADLARWTGGSMRVISMPEHVNAGVADMFEELRYQYLITFEPDPSPGWHPLEVRTRNKNLTVLARGGYMSGPARSED